jgi:hypothetical protein
VEDVGSGIVGNRQKSCGGWCVCVCNHGRAAEGRGCVVKPRAAEDHGVKLEKTGRGPPAMSSRRECKIGAGVEDRAMC